MANPPRIKKSAQVWKTNTGQDPAAYLVDPGSVTKPGKHRPGNLRHARPYIVSGSKIFVFPVGTEGFRRSGQSSLSLHRYIGHHSVDGRPMHYEEARIEMTGTFPGITSQQCMVDCIHVLTSIPPAGGMVLYAPGVFDHAQFVMPETWDFNHDDTDRTHSIDFTVTFVQKGTAQLVKDPKGVPPPPQPQRKVEPRGKASRLFRAKDGARSFQAIAQLVYNNSGLWAKLADLNVKLVNKAGLAQHQLPNHRWPIGTEIRY